MQQQELESEMRKQIDLARQDVGIEAKVPDFGWDMSAIQRYCAQHPDDPLVLAYRREEADVQSEARVISAAISRMRRKARSKLDVLYDLYLVSQR